MIATVELKEESVDMSIKTEDGITVTESYPTPEVSSRSLPHSAYYDNPYLRVQHQELNTLRHDLTDEYIEADDPEYLIKWLRCMALVTKTRPDLILAAKHQVWSKVIRVLGP